MYRRILMTKGNVLVLMITTALLAFLTNRFTGLWQLYKEETWDNSNVLIDRFFTTLIDRPLFFDDLSVTVSTLTIAAMVIFFFYKFDIAGEELMKRKHRNEEYGGAHWATQAEMDHFKNKKDEFNNILLSATSSISLDKIPDRRYERNKHFRVLGGSGSGKSFFFMKPLILQRFPAYAFTDLKGELLEDCGQFLIDHGYDLIVINTEDPSLSMGFNPFTMIKTEVDILRLANCIIDNTQPPEGHKDFWVQAEQLLYEFVIGYMWMFAPKEKQNIDTLIRLVGMAQVEEDNEKAVSPLDVLVNELEEKFTKEDNEYFLVELYRGFKKGAGKTLKSILVSCEVRLAPFKIPQVRAMMRHDEIGDFKRLVETKDTRAALFLNMSAGDNTYKFLTSMVFFRLFDDLMKYAKTCKGKRLPIDIIIGADEFAQIGRIPDIERHIAFLRSFGINIIICLQSDAQLESVYDENIAKVIKGNCDTTLFLGRCDHETNEEFSNSLGEETIIVENISRSKGGAMGDSHSVSEQRVGRKLMSASDLGDDNFPGDECIVKIKQAAPFKDKKYDTPNHPRYNELSDEPFDFAAHVKKQRIGTAKERIVKRYANRGMTLPAQDYYQNVVEELMLLDAA